ncbi:MAG: SDR family oxidoreductase [Rhodobacteraceae bacterium]|nr:SDR family oxidoreductase [Paracoccaceae bacterium]
MDVALDGKVIVVTGAASGIGEAIARLAGSARPAGLLLVDRDGAGLASAGDWLRAQGIPVLSHIADLGGVSGPRDAAAVALRRFGRIDGLVNAAGLTTRGSFTDGTVEVWDSLFAVNARAPFLLMQAAIADMRRRGAPGAIVNILSMNAHCGLPELAIYAASKGALATLTRNAAHAHMADRIRVNGINLGWVATPAEDRMQAEVLGRGRDWQAKAAAGLPLGRLVTAEEAARLTLFLLSDASVPMSGVTADLEQWVAGAPP